VSRRSTLYVYEQNYRRNMEEKVLPAGEQGSSPQVRDTFTRAEVLALVSTVKAETEKINPVKIAERILRENRIIYCAESFYRYDAGCYRELDRTEVMKMIKLILGLEFSSWKAREVFASLEAEAFLKTDDLNATDLLNVRNGLLDLREFRLIPHTPDVYSSIQLSVNYNPDARCIRWEQMLWEVFRSDRYKVEALQEFFGLCLTRETKYEKSLFCLGEGANGKSVMLHVLQQLLGAENYSAVMLEQLQNFHYTADLFGKLANISLECNAKSSVYDSIFKAVVSGDPIQADAKYRKPFKFRPFCKLVFALNNMPRVDDKTDAFFRRILLIRFTRQFAEAEQDKNLKTKLEAELDGIFLWSLEGLRRLRERGHFNITEAMQAEVLNYRRQNNNALLFVEDACDFVSSSTVLKDRLYVAYRQWCEENGCHPLSKIHFGKDLLKQHPELEEHRDAHGRYWMNIQLRPDVTVTEYDVNDAYPNPFLTDESVVEQG